jgi:MFS family permease
MIFVYFLGFLDKATLNYANAFTLQKDLHLQGNQYSWVATALNFGILAFIYPANICLQKLPIGRFVGICVVLSGAFIVGAAFAKNFQTLFVLRFLLGGIGCCINPAWLLLSSMFWTKEEQPWRMGLWLGFNGVSNIVGAAISYGLSFSKSSLATWQLIFIVVGAISIVFGIICFFVLPSDPSTCIFLTQEERAASVWRVRRNHTGTRSSHIRWYQVREAFQDRKVLLIALQTFSLGILIGSITNFASAILISFGFSNVNAALLQMPAGGFELVACLLAGFVVSRFRNALVITIIVCLLPGFAGIIGIAVIPLTKSNQWSLIGCAWLEGIFGSAIIMTYCLVTSNFAGHSKRTTVNTIVFLCFAAGEIAGK